MVRPHDTAEDDDGPERNDDPAVDEKRHRRTRGGFPASAKGRQDHDATPGVNKPKQVLVRRALPAGGVKERGAQHPVKNHQKKELATTEVAMRRWPKEAAPMEVTKNRQSPKSETLNHQMMVNKLMAPTPRKNQP